MVPPGCFAVIMLPYWWYLARREDRKMTERRIAEFERRRDEFETKQDEFLRGEASRHGVMSAKRDYQKAKMSIKRFCPNVEIRLANEIAEFSHDEWYEDFEDIPF